MAPKLDITSYIQQAQSLYGQFDQNMGGNTSDYMNSVFSVAGNVQGLTSDNDQQKAYAIQGILNNVMSLIEKIVSNEAAAAKREVSSTEKASKNLNKKIEEQRNELNTQIDQIGGEIDNQTGIVNTAVEEISNTQKAIQEKQEEINEIIEKIQEKQNELASTTDPTKQAQLLLEIQGLSGQITNVIASISELQSQVETASSNVENAVEQIETAKGNALEVQQTGEAQISADVQKSAQLTQTSIKTNATGIANNATGLSLEVSAEAASSNLLTAGTAPELYRKANDQQLAGDERTSGALTNLQSIMQGIGGISNNSSILSHFETTIGSAIGNFNSAVGSWNQALSPVIESFGSFSIIEGDIQTLNSAVETDLSNIPEDNQMADGHLANHKKADDAIFNGLGFKMPSTSATKASKNNEKVENTSGLQTPDVKLIAFEL